MLGDRFEALAVTQAALVMGIPIAHLHGGEITEGAFDDAIRHAITKMASVHFTAAEPYRQRVIQMGEAPERVFNVGAFGLDHLLRGAPMSLEALSDSLNFSLKSPYFLVTYHPVTLANEDPELTTRSLLAALEEFSKYRIILTYPNADNGGRRIIPLLKAYAQAREDRVHIVPSLGFRRYLTALRGASAMIGNSSSGIIEAPSCGVPTVDVGARQQGRLSAESVLHCAPNTDAIAEAITKAIDPAFAAAAKGVNNPYGQGDAARKSVAMLASIKLQAVKRFHDLETQR